MSIDLRHALREAVDAPGGRDDRALGGPGGLAALRARTRRARVRRAVARASAGTAALVAATLAVGALGQPGPGQPATAPTAAGPAADPRRPVRPSDSALCGAAVADLDDAAADLVLRLGLPGSDGSGTLVGRSLGAQVPVWVTADGPAVLPVRAADVVLVRDGTVVAVADDAAHLVAGDAATDGALADLPAPAGSGALRSCPGTDAAGLAGAVPSAGAYTLLAVAALGDGAEGRDDAGHVVSGPVPLTLLPEQGPLTADAALPADYPLADVPLVGDRVLSVVTAGIDGWKVTVAVTGTDALQRAAAALGAPGLPVTPWELVAGDGQGGVALDEDARARWGRAGADLSARRAEDGVGADAPYADLGGTNTSFSAWLRAGYDVQVTEQPGPGGVDTLVYRVTRD